MFNKQESTLYDGVKLTKTLPFGTRNRFLRVKQTNNAVAVMYSRISELSVFKAKIDVVFYISNNYYIYI